jgi:pyruvyltransferase
MISFKYKDYYAGTNRPSFRVTVSVDEALKNAGEPLFKCDIKKLYVAFPFDCWGNIVREKMFGKTRNLQIKE